MLKHGIFLICLLLILGCSHESAEMASAEISRSSGESRIETAGPFFFLFTVIRRPRTRFPDPCGMRLTANRNA